MPSVPTPASPPAQPAVSKAVVLVAARLLLLRLRLTLAMTPTTSRLPPPPLLGAAPHRSPSRPHRPAPRSCCTTMRTMDAAGDDVAAAAAAAGAAELVDRCQAGHCRAAASAQRPGDRTVQKAPAWRAPSPASPWWWSLDNVGAAGCATKKTRSRRPPCAGPSTQLQSQSVCQYGTSEVH